MSYETYELEDGEATGIVHFYCGGCAPFVGAVAVPHDEDEDLRCERCGRALPAAEHDDNGLEYVEGVGTCLPAPRPFTNVELAEMAAEIADEDAIRANLRGEA